jgi:hypothetical protein
MTEVGERGNCLIALHNAIEQELKVSSTVL